MIEKLKKLLFIEIGTIIFAIGIGLFLLPANILTGGVAGIVALIHPFIDFINEDILVYLSL